MNFSHLAAEWTFRLFFFFCLERVEGTTKGNIKTKGMICEYIAFIVTLNIYIIHYTAYYWNVLYDVGPYNSVTHSVSVYSKVCTTVPFVNMKSARFCWPPSSLQSISFFRLDK